MVRSIYRKWLQDVVKISLFPINPCSEQAKTAFTALDIQVVNPM